MSDRLSFVFHIDSIPMTRAVIEGRASLGGSESACLGLARALKARGHSVAIFTTKLEADAPDVDAWGVTWHPSHGLDRLLPLIDPDVFVALRQPNVFGKDIRARLRILWNQDMLVGEGAKLGIMSFAWAYDVLAYVSEYQRKQWEGVAHELAPLGWVTKNGFDASLVHESVQKVPHRIIHISRPERGLKPLLAMWPELKKRVPEAELHVCRYQSMYDGEGSHVKAMCESFDRAVEAVNAEVGGITYLGALGKPELYQAIAEASVMWYPGVVDFAETSCIAAIEAQACGTPFVGSYKGALPETVPYGVLIQGDAMLPEYQLESVELVEDILKNAHPALLRETVAMGKDHVASYTYDVIAAEWEKFVWGQFDQRSGNTTKVVASLLAEDDHVAAKALTDDPAIIAECDRVISGEAQTSEHYAKFALPVDIELKHAHPRFEAVMRAFEGCKKILDLACGNGAFAIRLAEADPTRHIHGIDYAKGNIDVAQQAVAARGLSDRVVFECAQVCDLVTGSVNFRGFHFGNMPGQFDGVFLGEFCEHVAGVTTLLTDVRRMVGIGVRVVITVPSGPFSDLLDPDTPKQKGHVHHFRPRDLEAIFGAQQDVVIDYLACGTTGRGQAVGHWVITFTTSEAPFGERPLTHWHRTIRPKQSLSVGILAHNCTPDLAKVLNDVWWAADQIIIADCASEDRIELERLAERYKATLLNLPPVMNQHGGFAEARNATLKAATGDWFLWVDADEQLVGNMALNKYLWSGVYRGYALKQNHFHLDAAQHFDTPVRLFKRGPDIEFYGCVHEQPQMGDCNGDITPALQLHDVQIAHTGYLHEGIRRGKALNRNLPLLVRDREVFPDRRLGLVLVLRDLVNQALWREEDAGRMTDVSKELLSRAIACFEQHFMDPTDKFHAIARPFYETALQRVATAIEVEFALGGAPGGLKGRRAQPIHWWVRERAQMWPLIEHEQAKVKAAEAPFVLDVEPIAMGERVAV